MFFRKIVAVMFVAGSSINIVGTAGVSATMVSGVENCDFTLTADCIYEYWQKRGDRVKSVLGYFTCDDRFSDEKRLSYTTKINDAETKYKNSQREERDAFVFGWRMREIILELEEFVEDLQKKHYSPDLNLGLEVLRDDYALDDEKQVVLERIDDFRAEQRISGMPSGMCGPIVQELTNLDDFLVTAKDIEEVYRCGRILKNIKEKWEQIKQIEEAKGTVLREI